MLSQELVYSEERGTWNLFVNNEWYFEGPYDQCEQMMLNNAAEEFDDYPEEPYPYEEEDWERDLEAVQAWERKCEKEIGEL